jgi:HEAT repeat protein
MRYLTLLVISVLLINCSSKDDVAIRESNKFIARHQYDNARAVIEKALREDPKNTKLLRQQVRYFLCTEQVLFCIAANNKLLEVSHGDQTLYHALGDENPVVRITAVRAFGETKGPDSLAALIKAASDQDKSIRQAVIQALTKLGDKNALPALQKLLQDNDWFVRGNAALALGKIGDAESVSQLFKALGDTDSYVRKSAQLSLWRLASPGNLSAYQAALGSPDTASRSTAALILAANGNKDASPVLLTELNNPSNPDLPEIIRTLAKTKDPAALPGLRQALNSANDEVKISAILALGDYQDKGSVETLKTIQKDPKTTREARTACVVALSKISKK